MDGLLLRVEEHDGWRGSAAVWNSFSASSLQNPGLLEQQLLDRKRVRRPSAWSELQSCLLNK